MKDELISEATGTPVAESTSDTKKAQMFFDGRSERFIISVGGLERESDIMGAIRIGELTCLQYTIFRQEFSKAYQGQYCIRFHCEQPLSDRDKLSLHVALSNRKFLADDQKKALDIAHNIADLVRKTCGCENKNSGAQKVRVTSKTQKPQNPTKGAVNNALLVIFHKNKNAVNYTAERLVDILASQKPPVKSSKSSVIGTDAWKTYCAPLRKKEKICSVNEPGSLRDPNAVEDPSQVVED